MLTDIGYDRNKVLQYAKRWAFDRNPRFLDFENLGGDCTNFASQCIYAGAGVMNYTPTFGWYYNSARDRSPSWTGVQYLYNFLIQNRKAGPYAAETDPSGLEIGDIIQLGHAERGFYHSPVVTAVTPDGIFVAAHTFDAFMRPLNTYVYDRIRYLHILGVRKYI